MSEKIDAVEYVVENLCSVFHMMGYEPIWALGFLVRHIDSCPLCRKHLKECEHCREALMIIHDIIGKILDESV